jgi:RHS repeat-associated protein
MRRFTLWILGVGSLFLCLLAPVGALAQEAADDSASAANDAKKVPALLGLPPPESAGQVPAFGAASEHLPLEITPGRKQFQPHLSLSYSSLGGRAELGLGWLLDVGHIERSSRHGTPALFGPNEFIVSIAGTGAELVSTGGTSYRPKVEAEFKKYDFFVDHWEVRDGQGNLYRFGTTAASRIDNESWFLDSVEDPNGNAMTIQYVLDAGFLYPTQINYNGHVPTGDPGADRITFEYEARDDQSITYILGTLQTRTRRLRRISNFVGTTLVRRYQVSYDQSPTTHRDRVVGVDLVGSDDSSSVPARRYGYQDSTLGWNATGADGTLPINFVASDGHDPGVRSLDVNGDNVLDLVDNGNNVYLGDGTGHFTASASWSASLVAAGVKFVDDRGVDTGTRLVDVNGDLRPDLLVAPSGGGGRVLLNDGSGWVLDAAYTATVGNITETAFAQLQFLGIPCTPVDEAGADSGDAGPDALPSCEAVQQYSLGFSLVQSTGDSSGVYLADVNGDGLLDFVWNYQTTPTLFNAVFNDASLGRAPANIQAVYINTGSGWARNDTLSNALAAIPPFVVDTRLQGYDVIDVNGDGLADIVNTLQGSPDNRTVLLGTGTGWAANADFTASLRSTQIFSLSDNKSLGLLPVDFNGDGLIDYIRSDAGITVAYRNTGVGWAQEDGITNNLAQFGFQLVNDGMPNGYTFGDVDGDGLPDLLLGKDGGPQSFIRLASGPAPDLLTSVTTALGESVAFTYAPSSSFDNHSPGTVENLPTVISVVKALSRSDGNGTTFTGSFEYSGGLFATSQFRGFATVATTDPRGVTTQATYHQEQELIGQAAQNKTFDAAGGLRKEIDATYNLVAAAPGVTQVQFTQTDTQIIDPGGVLHTRVGTQYDTFLNVTEIDRDGDVDVTGDEARTTFTYATNDALGFHSLPAHIRVFGPDGALAQESIITYDGLAEGLVSKGNPTQTSDAVTIGGPFVTRRVAYDVYGNATQVTDRNGNSTSFGYDATHTFRNTSTDPLGRTTSTTRDARFGLPTTETDWNGKTTSRTYDIFGRLTREVSPGDESSPNGTRSFVYSSLGPGQFVESLATELQGSSQTFNVFTFFDGFGQLRRLEAPGDGGRTVAMTWTYDDAGQLIASTTPSFVGDPSATTRFDRDALRRVLTRTFPNGALETTTYAGKQRTTVDRRGNRTLYVLDAYDHIVETHQFTGGQELVTKTKFDAFGNTVQITDAIGELTRIAYDALERKTAVDDPNAGSYTYAYDGNGNLTSRRDARNRVITKRYDADGEIVEKDLDGRAITFTYGTAADNAVGRVSHAVDAAGSIDVRYDARGAVHEHRRTINGQTFITRYAYDSRDRLRTVVYPDGFVANYEYGPGGLASRIVGGDGVVIVDNIRHDATGAVQSMSFGNGVSSTYGHDLEGQLTAVATTGPNARILQNLAYTYDANKNIATITDGSPQGLSQSFVYDEINRLVRADSDPNQGYATEQYQYDGVGNFLRKGDLQYRYAPGASQRPTCIIDDVLASQPHGPGDDPCARGAGGDRRGALRNPGPHPHSTTAIPMEFDAVGNLTRQNQTRYNYDSENQLTTVTDMSGFVLEQNIYDASGSRVFHSLRGQAATLIDNIYEQFVDEARRHIRLNSIVVATIISRGPVTLLTPGRGTIATVVRGESVRTDETSQGCAIMRNQAPASAETALFFALLIAGISWRRGTQGRHLARARKHLASALRGSYRKLRRKPVRWLASLFLVVVQIANMSPKPAQAQVVTPPTLDMRFYYHTDHLGNVNVVTDRFGNVQERRDYTPFGEQVRFNGQVGDQRFGESSFNDMPVDDDVSLYYFGARHYHPLTGRFLTADTILPDQTPASLHRYAFAANNPVRYVDVTGHDFWDVLEAIAVVVLVVVATVVTFGVALGVIAVGATLAAVLVGASIGILVGAVTALVLYATHDLTNWGQALGLVVIGGLAGASVGGAVAAGSIAFGSAATAAGKLAFLTLSGAAIGAIGGTSVVLINGRPDLIFQGGLLGLGVGAAAGFLTGLSLAGAGAGFSALHATISSAIANAQLIGALASGAAFAFTASFGVVATIYRLPKGKLDTVSIKSLFITGVLALASPGLIGAIGVAGESAGAAAAGGGL